MMIKLFMFQIVSLILLSFIKSSASQVIEPRATVGGFVDSSSCRDGLVTADENMDDKVDRDEYLNFTQAIGPTGFLEDANGFDDIPLLLQSNFLILACLCKSNGGDDQCCVGDNAHISIEGAGPNDSPTLEQTSYLSLVCWLTSQTIDNVLLSFLPTENPSLAPTMIPSPTELPSGAPSEGPTASPSVSASSNPTADQSGNPTPKPSLAPSIDASSSPTITTSSSPTSVPTVNPTVSESGTPTLSSSNGPTPVHSGIPSEILSDSPSESTTSPTTPVASAGPTPSPTQGQSITPTVSTKPSTPPTMTLTLEPSSSPTEAQTTSPSDMRSSSPSTDSPQMQTQSPTISPSPTTVPSIAPSTSPTATAEPTGSPSSAPSSPTQSPSTSEPTAGMIDVVGRTTYSIVVANGQSANIPRSAYVPDLIGAMDVVAVELAAEMEATLGNNGGRLRRKLSILVDLPTSVDGIIDAGGFTTDAKLVDGVFEQGACPADLGNPEADRCEVVIASAGLYLIDENALQVQQLFQSELEKAILSGRLQENIDKFYPNSLVTVISGRESDGGGGSAPAVPISADDREGLSVGATAGVAISAFAVVGMVALLLFATSRRRDDKSETAELEPVPPATGLEWGEQLEEEGKMEDVELGPATTSVGLIGASKPDYGKTQTDQRNAAVSPGKRPALPQVPVVDDSSSPADSQQKTVPLSTLQAVGSSAEPLTDTGSQVFQDDMSETDAYSGDPRSSAGERVSSSGLSRASSDLSDVYTSSMGTMESDEMMPGSQLVDLSAGGVLQQQRNLPGVANFEDLEAAITSGDWAAVGASAALLASTQYDSSNSMSKSSASGFSSSDRGRSWKLALDATKAAELDQLIDTGDWEGVIMAAARFEAEDNAEAPTHSDGSSDESHSASHSGSHPSSGSGYLASTGSGSGGSATNPSMSTLSMSDAAAKNLSLEGLRQEVVALVERVVPEEIDHVDEMMTQFKGREDELLETLRTMQEREIATKARKAVQRQAKLETSGKTERYDRRVAAIEAASARAQTMQSSNPPQNSLSGPVFVAADATGDVSSESQSATTGSAVANPDSVNSEQASGEAGHVFDSIFSGEESSEDRRRHRTALYSAIDSGNWEAVGEAAAMLSDTDQSDLHRTFESSRSTSTPEHVRSRREELTDMIEGGDWLGVVVAASRYGEAEHQIGAAATDDETRLQRQLAEEKEALRQAEVWMEVAKQSRVQAGEQGAAAADAADWAIARSLSLLEGKGEESGSGKAEHGADDDEQESV